jgi:hypothetical protein
MGDEVYDAIEQSTKNIRKKYLMLKKDTDEQEMLNKTMFKPIVEPLQDILKLKKENIEHQDEQKQIVEFEDEEKDVSEIRNKKASDLFIRYLNQARDNNSKWDKTFGIRVENSKMYLGNSQLRQVGSYIRIMNAEPVPMTAGLLELLFFKKPDTSIVSRADFSNYKILLEISNAHKCTRINRLKCSKSFKYNEIIKKIFRNASGSSLPKTFATKVKNMSLDANKTNITYWDDPNEIIERLRFLLASQQAGHDGHNNEIYSIIEELKESNIIQ